MAQDGSHTLYAVPGTGSAIVEALLSLAGVPFALHDLAYEELGPGGGELQMLNPLGQVPTLILPDGTVMTESAAITLRIAEQYPEARLAPAASDPARSRFLRWLVSFGSPLYATFTYGDEPGRWVPKGEPARTLRKATDAHRESLWQYLENEISPAPWLLGHEFSALDVFICVMTHWRPGRDWFAEHCPELFSIAKGLEEDTRLAAVWTRNFS